MIPHKLGAAEKQIGMKELHGQFVVGLQAVGDATDGKIMSDGQSAHRRLPGNGASAKRPETDGQSPKRAEANSDRPHGKQTKCNATQRKQTDGATAQTMGAIAIPPKANNPPKAQSPMAIQAFTGFRNTA